jgi:hypothetical protein
MNSMCQFYMLRGSSTLIRSQSKFHEALPSRGYGWLTLAGSIVTQAQKLMHRFSEQEVEKLIDEAEQGVA